MTTKTQGMSAEDLANDVNVVAMWTSVDKARWAAGLVSGWIAGVIAMAVAGLIAINHGYQFVFPVKLLGTCFAGRSSDRLREPRRACWPAQWFCAFIFGLWGFVYGHFVRSNSAYTLLGMGFTWGAFLWIFDWNLILHSVKTISASEVPSGAAFATCMAYGFGMSVIAIVEPIFKGGRRS